MKSHFTPTSWPSMPPWRPPALGKRAPGFSVVADEVRSLVHRAVEAARSSGAIEQTLGDVSRGVEFATHAYGAFKEVALKITSGTELVSQIAASSGEQARGIASITQAITRIESLTERNVANAQQTSVASVRESTAPARSSK